MDLFSLKAASDERHDIVLLASFWVIDDCHRLEVVYFAPLYQLKFGEITLAHCEVSMLVLEQMLIIQILIRYESSFFIYFTVECVISRLIILD